MLDLFLPECSTWLIEEEQWTQRGDIPQKDAPRLPYSHPVRVAPSCGCPADPGVQQLQDTEAHSVRASRSSPNLIQNESDGSPNTGNVHRASGAVLEKSYPSHLPQRRGIVGFEESR